MASCRRRVVPIVVGGIGLLTDFYDFSVINLVRPILDDLYPGASASYDSMVTASSIVGSACGMLVLGALADVLGRRHLLLVSGGLTFLGALGSALAFPVGHASVWLTLCVWRFVMGVGIGGEYPLSASYTAEGSDAGASGWRLALVYSMMGVGQLLATLVVYACELARAPAEITWRLAFGLGAALSLFAIVLRYHAARDSDAFINARREARAAEPAVAAGFPGAGGLVARVAAPVRRTLRTMCQYRRALLGTALGWLLYDVIDYGLGLYSSKIVSALGLDAGVGGPTRAVLVVQLVGFPGYFASIWLVPRLGRRATQLAGAAGMLSVYVALAVGYDAIAASPALFITLFGLQLLCDNAGPGATTYVIPGEIYPTSVRATCHGLSAGCGKLGAALGAYAFNWLLDEHRGLGVRSTFGCTAVVAAALLALTLAATPRYDDETLRHLDGAHRSGLAAKLLYEPSAYFDGEARARCEDSGRLGLLDPAAPNINSAAAVQPVAEPHVTHVDYDATPRIEQ